MRRVILSMFLAASASAQSLPSPELSATQHVGAVMRDYCRQNGSATAEGLFIFSQKGIVTVKALPAGVPVPPSWSTLFAPTNVTAVVQKAAQLSATTNGWTKDQRMQFEINFDQENRIRVLESKPAITKQQYFNALNTVWTNLP